MDAFIFRKIEQETKFKDNLREQEVEGGRGMSTKNREAQSRAVRGKLEA